MRVAACPGAACSSITAFLAEREDPQETALYILFTGFQCSYQEHTRVDPNPSCVVAHDTCRSCFSTKEQRARNNQELGCRANTQVF